MVWRLLFINYIILRENSHLLWLGLQISQNRAGVGLYNNIIQCRIEYIVYYGIVKVLDNHHHQHSYNISKLIIFKSVHNYSLLQLQECNVQVTLLTKHYNRGTYCTISKCTDITRW